MRTHLDHRLPIFHGLALAVRVRLNKHTLAPMRKKGLIDVTFKRIFSSMTSSENFVSTFVAADSAHGELCFSNLSPSLNGNINKEIEKKIAAIHDRGCAGCGRETRRSLEARAHSAMILIRQFGCLTDQQITRGSARCEADRWFLPLAPLSHGHGCANVKAVQRVASP
jgi:hypothetical protein